MGAFILLGPFQIYIQIDQANDYVLEKEKGILDQHDYHGTSCDSRSLDQVAYRVLQCCRRDD